MKCEFCDKQAEGQLLMQAPLGARTLHLCEAHFDELVEFVKTHGKKEDGTSD